MAQASAVSSKLLQRYPWVSRPIVVSAPMRVLSGPALAVSTSQAGGLGFIGPGAKTQDTITDLEEASSLIQQSRASAAFSRIPSTNSVLPVGVGFQLWKDELDTAVTGIKKHKPCAVWLFAPHRVEEFASWSHRICEAYPSTQIWIQIGTLGEVKAILKGSEHPDVFVVQGAESGGHGRAKDGIGLISLLPEVVDAVASSSQIPIFGAGGIADGRGAAAALCLGASGVAMGTRFLAASEARVSRGYQDEIIRAADGAVSTTRTLLYNHLRGTYGWPKEYSPRTIINKSFTEHEAGKPFEELQKFHDEAMRLGDGGWGPEGRLGTYAGASIGLVHDIKPAADIVREVRQEVSQRVHLLQDINA